MAASKMRFSRPGLHPGVQTQLCGNTCAARCSRDKGLRRACRATLPGLTSVACR